MTLALWFCLAAPARADILACFEALLPYEQAAKATELASKSGACTSVATGDPLMAMTIAGMMAAAAAGEFSSAASCKAKIDGVVGHLIAEALLKVPGLPDAAKKLLREFVEGRTPLTFTEIIAGVPGLQPVVGYIECGCTVATVHNELLELAKEYSETVQECGSFFADAAGVIGGAASDVGESIHRRLHPSAGGIAPEVPCPPMYVMPNDIWTKSRIHRRSEYFACSPYPYCAAGKVILAKEDPPNSGTQWYKCTERCPDPQPAGVSGKCSHTNTWWESNGYCEIGAEVECCEREGARAVSWRVCGPACKDGEYFDRTRRTCLLCPENQTPRYVSPGETSIGSCSACPSGLISNVLTGGQCSTCPVGQVMWSFEAPQTSSTPSGIAIDRSTQPNLQQTVPRPVPRPKSSATGTAALSTALARPLPPGMTLASLAGTCTSCPANWTPVYHSDPAKSSLGYCEECPPGTYSRHDVVQMLPIGALGTLRPDPNPGRCRPLDCRYGFDPKSPHTCLASLPLKPDLPVAPAVPVPRPELADCAKRGANYIRDPRQPTKCVACGRGFTPNKARTACVAIARPSPPQAVRPAPKCPPGMVPFGTGCAPLAAPLPLPGMVPPPVFPPLGPLPPPPGPPIAAPPPPPAGVPLGTMVPQGR